MAWENKHPEEWTFEETENFLEETSEVLKDVNENLPEYEESARYDEKIDNVLSQLDSIQSVAEINGLSAERVEALAGDNYEDAQELYDDFLELREAVHERDEVDHRMLNEVNNSLRNINSALEDVQQEDYSYKITKREAIGWAGGLLAAVSGAAFFGASLGDDDEDSRPSDSPDPNLQVTETISNIDRVGDYLEDEVQGSSLLSAERNWGDLMAVYDFEEEEFFSDSDRTLEEIEIIYNQDPGEHSEYGVSMGIDGGTEYDTRTLKDDRAAESALEYFEVNQ